MALKVGELFASFNLDTSGIGSALNGAEKSLSSAGKSLAVGGAAVTAAVTAPLIAAGKDIAKKGSEFDAQMSKVFAIAGDEVTGSAEAMEKLRAKALEMGSTTQFTATEAGEAFEYMAMAGWKTESMLSAIEPLMNLAAAAGADLGTTSDIVTDAMTAFGLKATDMMTVVKDGVQMSVPAVEYFADILAATSTNSNTNVTMLGESFKYVAPLAGSFGYSLNDVSLALGLMANNGIKSTMAGTSLSRVIQNMTKPSKETKEAMSALGLSLYDAKGQMKPLREVMNDFRGVAKKNGIDVSKLSEDVAKLSDKLEKGEITEKQYEKELAKLTDGSGDFMKYVTQIAGARGLPGLLAIMNASQEDFDSLAKSIDNATGSSKKMKDVMLDNMKGDLTIFKSAVEGLEITLWDLVKEPMRGLVQRGTQIVDKFRNMDKSTQKGALRMAAFAAAIGPAMTAAGGLLTVLPKIRKVLLGLASPVGLVSIGLLALGAAAMDADNLMGQNLEKMANTAKTKLQDLQKNLLGKHLVLSGRANRFLGSVQRAITTAVPGIVDAVSGLLQTGLAALTDVLPEAAKTATTMVSTLASGIARNAPQLTKTLAGTLTSLATSVISAVPEMLDAGVKLFSALIDSLGKVNWKEIGTKINTAVTDALKEIKTNFYALVFGKEPTEEDLGDWGPLGAKLVENIKAGIKTASQNGKNLIGKLTLGSDYSPDATSWGAIAVKIWKIIQDKFAALKQNVKNLIGKLALGSDYTPETTWAQVGEKIWNVIKSGITAAGDWIKQLVLGENYTPDASWSTVGSAIWAKIKTGFTAVGDWVKRLVMGKDYTPDNTWSDVGKKIWDRIKSGITVTGDWLKTKLGYTPSDSWTTVGSGIWKKIKSGISDKGDWLKTKLGYNATDDWKTVGSGILAKIKEGIGTAEAFAASILEKIGTVDIDVEKVQAVVKNAGAFVTGLVGKMLNGKIEWGSKITGVAAKIAEQLRTFDWSGVGTDLGMSAANMVRGMIDMIPKAVDAAGKALDLGAELAGGILTSVVTGIKTLAAEGAGNKLGDAATELLHGILTGISDFGNNENVKTFVTNLGDGIRSAMGMLGDVCGKMIAYIFSADGIRAIYNAGVTVLDVILQGMAAGIGGVMSFFSNMFDNILIQAGLIDPKARDAANAAGAELANALTAGAESELSKGMRGQNLMTLMQYALTHGGQGGQFDGKWSLDDNLNMALNSMLDTQGKTVEEFKQNFMDLWMEEHAFFNSGDFTEFWKDLFPEWKDFDDNSLKEHVGELFEEYDSIAEIVKSKLGPDYWSHYFTDDMGFWEAMYNALSSGDTTALMQLMSSQAALLFGDNTTKAADEEDKVVKEAMTKLYGDTAESVQEGAAQVKQSVVDSMSDTANAFGKEGFEKALKDNTEPVKTAAAEVSDAAVKEFLLTMSEENGYLIGDNFVLALGFGMSGQTDTLKQTAVSVARSGYTSMSQTANYNMGYSIGSNFGRGFVNGIRAMIDEAAQAAAELGAAGTAGLSGSIQEGSPSKITAMSGTNFGLGFVNSILLMADQAADAAREMGVEALSALDYTARDMGRTAIDQTDMKQRSAYTRTAEAAREARGGSADMQELTDRIVTALEKVGVYIDGEEAGHLLTRYISEEIAEGASARR